MTAFRFSLQKVLELRRKQLDLEESKFKQQTAAIAALDRARDDLQSARLREEEEVCGAALLSGQDLAALSTFHVGIQRRQGEIAKRKAECERQLVAQQAVMLEARRRCRLLERLRDRRMAEWESARDKELEEMAAESFLARWPRR